MFVQDNRTGRSWVMHWLMSRSVTARPNILAVCPLTPTKPKKKKNLWIFTYSKSIEGRMEFDESWQRHPSNVNKGWLYYHSSVWCIWGSFCKMVFDRLGIFSCAYSLVCFCFLLVFWFFKVGGKLSLSKVLCLFLCLLFNVYIFLNLVKGPASE